MHPETDHALLPTTCFACPHHTIQHHPRTRSRTSDRRSTRRPSSAKPKTSTGARRTGGVFQALDPKTGIQVRRERVRGIVRGIGRRWRRPAVRGVRKNRYREATRTLQSGVPDNLRGCWSRLYPKASRSKYQSIKEIHRVPPRRSDKRGSILSLSQSKHKI